MNKTQIIELYSYDEWANTKILTALGDLENEEYIQDLSSGFKSIRDTMVHLLGTEELWLSRWMGEHGRILLNPEDLPTYSTFVDRGGAFRNQLQVFLVSLTEEDLLEEISYETVRGEAYSLELWKQMLHVTNHSSHHRGQVVTMLRQLKKAPPSLDMIHYYLGER